MGANQQTSVPAFTSGQVLTAQQQTEINTGVPVFADSTARDAAFGGTGEKVLAQGQLAYLEDSDIVQYYDGSVWATVGPAAPSGVVQVKSTTKSDTFTMSSTVFADVTGLTVSITPTSASNKIVVIMSLMSSNENVNLYSRLMRDSTAIAIGDTAGSRSTVTGAAFASDNSEMVSTAMTFLDSPATTSALTYKVQIAIQGGALAVYVNRGQSDTDSSSRPRGVSTITVMEVTP